MQGQSRGHITGCGTNEEMTYRDRIKCMANTGRRCRTQLIMRNGAEMR